MGELILVVKSSVITTLNYPEGAFLVDNTTINNTLKYLNDFVEVIDRDNYEVAIMGERATLDWNYINNAFNIIRNAAYPNMSFYKFLDLMQKFYGKDKKAVFTLLKDAQVVGDL